MEVTDLLKKKKRDVREMSIQKKQIVNITGQSAPNMYC